VPRGATASGEAPPPHARVVFMTSVISPREQTAAFSRQGVVRRPANAQAPALQWERLKEDER